MRHAIEGLPLQFSTGFLLISTTPLFKGKFLASHIVLEFQVSILLS